MFKYTVEIHTSGDRCDRCPLMRYGQHIECGLFGKRLRPVDGYLITDYLRCADCKKAEKAAEKANG